MRGVRPRSDYCTSLFITSYGINALGQASSLVTPHALYRALGATDDERLSVYRALFRAQLDKAAIDEIRLALNQS